MVALVGKVSPSLSPMKYTVAPGGDGVGPPWLLAAPATNREPNIGTTIKARILDIMAFFPVVECTIAAPKEASREDILLPCDVNPSRLPRPMRPRENVSLPCAAMASSRRLADLAKITHGASTCASGEA